MIAEFGRTKIIITDKCSLFDGIAEVGDIMEVWMSHRDYVSIAPPGFKIVARSVETGMIAAIAYEGEPRKDWKIND